MRRGLKILAWIVAIAIALPLLLVGVIIAAANTDPGRRAIEALAPRLTGGMVRIEGLSGRFPDVLKIRRLLVADADGVWLTVNDARLNWSPRRLLEGKVAIQRLEARRVAVERLPASNSSGGSYPVPRVMLSRLRVERLEIGPAIAGQPVEVAVAGAGQITAQDSGEVHLAVTALRSSDGASLDHYSLEIAIDPARAHATLSVAESPHGLLAGLAALPDIGPIAIEASVDGPTNALSAKAKIEAGSLRGGLDGRLDAIARAADLKFTVLAPAMTPGPGVGWSAVRLDGNLHGPLTAPMVTATVAADGLIAAGAEVGSLRANVAGDATGKTDIHAGLDRLRVPGPSPEVLAGGPLTVDASIQLADARRPFNFALRHKLFSAEGSGDTARGRVRLTVPDLAPFAAIGGADLHGQTTLDFGVTRANDTIEVTLSGGIGIADGMRPVPALVGGAGTIDLAASLRDDVVVLSRLRLTGAGFNASAKGQLDHVSALGRPAGGTAGAPSAGGAEGGPSAGGTAGGPSAGGPDNQRSVEPALSLEWNVALSNLEAVQPALTGAIEAHGQAAGSPTALTITADLTGNLAAQGQRLEQVSAHVSLEGLPNAPAGRVTAGGSFLGAPLDVAIGAERRDGGFHIAIDRATWKSLTAGGTLDAAPGGTLPTGKITLSLRRLADLTPLLGRPIAGDLTASLELSATVARVNAVVVGGGVPGTASVSRAALDATVTDPSGDPLIDGTLTLDGAAAGGVRASGRLAAKGKLPALNLDLAVSAPDLSGLPGRLEASGTLNADAQTLALASLRGTWGPQPVRLLAPASIGFANGVAIDRLRLGFRQGELAAAGRWVASGNGLRLTMVNIPVDIAAAIAPGYAADGTIAGDATLTGTPAQPAGTIHVSASGIRLRTGPGRALPSAAVTLNGTLEGTSARLDARLAAGTSTVTATGRVPLSVTGPLDLRVGGAVDLALLNPLVAAGGRQVRGRLDLALGIVGTPGAPKASGTARLSNGDFQDASLGVHVASISAAASGAGDVLRIERVQGTAGPGTVSASGSISIAGTPTVDLTIRASNAKILATDLATALIDANLTLRGPVSGTPALAGSILARSAEIRVPETLPPTIAVLKVREAGAPLVKPPPPVPAPDLSLNVTLDAPDEIYIRGRGVDAELGGRVIFAGTAASPIPRGRLQLRRGSFSIAGQSLNLTEGTIDFAGGPLTNPQLKLVATSSNASVTSTLTISGDVRNPKIVLSSVPDMPQDEILSQLLFNTARTKLSPFQVAQIVAALAEISGVGPSGGDPLGKVRSALGLDQLSVGSDPNGGTTLQAGRYLARGVRLGASQSASGGGTQATVQIDIAKGLKLETTVGTGTSSATPDPGGSTNGSGVGVTYEFEY